MTERGVVAETVREMWQDYARAVLPRNASPTQVIETRRAFYGGAWSLQCRCEANTIAGMETADFVAWLEKLEAEQKAFRDSIGTPLEGRTA